MIILFHMCFGIRISSPFHLNTLNMPIQNIKCPRNTKITFRHWLWAVKWRRDDGWNTWKHISCLEEEITKLCNHFISSLNTYPSTKHRTEQCDSWIALSVTQIGFGMLVQRRHSSSFTNNGWEENYFSCFWGTKYSEWVCLKCLDRTGSKFWFRNTCEKV